MTRSCRRPWRADSLLVQGAQLVEPIPIGIALRPGDSRIDGIQKAVKDMYDERHDGLDPDEVEVQPLRHQSVTEPVRPEPDVKDWTWTLRERCPDCGFAAGDTRAADVPAIVEDVVARFSDRLGADDARRPPEPDHLVTDRVRLSHPRRVHGVRRSAALDAGRG